MADNEGVVKSGAGRPRLPRPAGWSPEWVLSRLAPGYSLYHVLAEAVTECGIRTETLRRDIDQWAKDDPAFDLKLVEYRRSLGGKGTGCAMTLAERRGRIQANISVKEIEATQKKLEDFLLAYAASANVKLACEDAGISDPAWIWQRMHTCDPHYEPEFVEAFNRIRLALAGDMVMKSVDEIGEINNPFMRIMARLRIAGMFQPKVDKKVEVTGLVQHSHLHAHAHVAIDGKHMSTSEQLIKERMKYYCSQQLPASTDVVDAEAVEVPS